MLDKYTVHCNEEDARQQALIDTQELEAPERLARLQALIDIAMTDQDIVIGNIVGNYDKVNHAIMSIASLGKDPLTSSELAKFAAAASYLKDTIREVAEEYVEE